MRQGLCMAALLVGLALCYLLPGSGLDMDYILPRRLMKLAAMVLGGTAVAVAATSFQTIAANRILTPAVMGYEAIFLLWQALLVLAFGTASLGLLGENGNFLLSILLMLLWSWGLHRFLFHDGRADIWHLLLVGLVLTMVITTVTQFVQLRISPGEFAVFQSFAQLSFDRIAPERLLWSALLLAGVMAIGLRGLAVLDVLGLGRDQAVSLGVDHIRALRLWMVLIAVLVAVSTSLIGPSAFLGIFVANLARALAPRGRHAALLPLGSAIAIALFLIAQIMVEQLFNYKTTVGILVNLACGLWFLALMLQKGFKG